MSVKTTTIIYTIYGIKCDYCGREENINTLYENSIYNRRMAVRSLGWTLQRYDKVMCSTCRCYNNKKNTIKI